MIWQYQDCPMCGRELILANGSGAADDPIAIFRCPTSVEMPEDIKAKAKSAYLKDSISSHFDLEFQNYKPYHQVIRLFPFVVSGYNDCVNISKYDENLHLHFVTETAPINFPWQEPDKLLKKLQMYTLFS